MEHGDLRKFLREGDGENFVLPDLIDVATQVSQNTNIFLICIEVITATRGTKNYFMDGGTEILPAS